MANFQTTSTGSCTRRRLRGWGTAGTFAGLAGWLGWPRHASSSFNSAAEPTGASSTQTPPAAAATAVPATTTAAPGTSELGRDAFLPHLHSKFQLSGATGGATDCQLDAVSAATVLVSPNARFTSFSLLFTAAADFAGESRIYRLSHDRLGSMDLFLCPVGKSATRVQLEAVLSQRI